MEQKMPFISAMKNNFMHTAQGCPDMNAFAAQYRKLTSEDKLWYHKAFTDAGLEVEAPKS